MAKWTASLTVDGESRRIVSLSHRERVNEVALSRCVAVFEGEPPTLKDLVGKAATILVEDPELGKERRIAGIVTSISIEELGDDFGEPMQRIDFDVEPRLARLALRTDCRTFQHMTADAIAKKVLEGAGYSSDEIEVRASEALPERDWVVQYEETDLAFLTRLLAEEGMSFTVVEKDDVDRVVIFDGDLGPSAPSTLPFKGTVGFAVPDEYIADLVMESSPRPGKVTMREYDFAKPRLGLEVKEEADADADFEVFVPRGRYVDEGAGKRKAKLHLEALRTGRNQVRASSTALGLAVGSTVTVEGHPYEKLNASLWLRAIRLEYAEAQARARLEIEAVLADDGPVRPDPVPFDATAAGLQTAFVTGASGQEISADEHGRVTLWFPWDRIEPKDEKSSLPVRAMQLPLGGSQLTPRVGWEVGVGAFEGDLDAPLVLGRMMNAAAPPPYPLPAGKTKFAIQTATTPGGGSVNEIRFDDAAGSEELFMNASKDASVGVGNNATDKVTVDEVRTIGGDQSIEIGGGWTGKYKSSQTVTVSGSQTAKSATKAVDESGSHTLSVGADRNLTVGGDYQKKASGASTLDVSANAIDLVVGSFDTHAKATFAETVGAADIILASKKNLHVVGARSEEAGAAKIILVAGDRVASAASLSQSVTAAIGNIISGDRTEEAGGDFTEVAVGAHVVQAASITIEAEDLLSIVMGASTITLTPAAIAIAGVSVTLDGTAAEGIAVLDL
jgi:type VI secretion system secreted protein VgrG